MKIAAVQFNPEFGAVEKNLAKAESLISGQEADLYVLPELCFSGYTFISKEEAYSLSESVQNGYTIKRMADFSLKMKAAIIFGFPERFADNLYNSCAFIAPNGQIKIYRKIHLFMNEKDWFRPGDQPLDIYSFMECDLGLMICFDWRFPEVARALALKGAHILCHPANLVQPYCQAAMITRCLENRVFAITSNRYGIESRGPFSNVFTGKSQIIGPKGEILVSSPKDKDSVCIADINYRESEDKSINPKNNLWDDRRPELYLREDYG